MTDQPEKPRLGRRLLTLKLGAGVAATLGGAAAAQGLKDAPRQAPVAPPPQRSGISDSDPSDPPGQGRGTGARPPQSGMSDADPTDPPGGGRGGNRQQTGLTDSDPTDPPGGGRGQQQQGPRKG
jgi:hypothetical protein